MSVQVLIGDCRTRLTELDVGSVQCVVTSPPYFGLRSYEGGPAEIGQEQTPAEYVAALVGVFREVWRVLAGDGVLWLNLGDSYANDGKWGGATGGKHADGLHGQSLGRMRRTTGLKPKDLIGVPWRVAFALQDDGWWLRQEIIWAKGNPMPESVQDRCTRSHETVFMLTKNATYFYDAQAIAEPAVRGDAGSTFTDGKTGVNGMGRVSLMPRRGSVPKQDAIGIPRYTGFNERWNNSEPSTTRNKRSVWHVNPTAYPDAHYAVFPERLIEPMILAGSRPGDLVLDPFAGSGTTLAVAVKHRRRAVGVELNPAYAALVDKRLNGVQVTLPFEEVTA